MLAEDPLFILPAVVRSWSDDFASRNLFGLRRQRANAEDLPILGAQTLTLKMLELYVLILM